MENYLKFTTQLKQQLQSFATDSSALRIHFIYLNGGYTFVMSHFIAIASAHYVHAPCQIFIHTDKEPEDNKWWNEAAKIAKIVHIIVPDKVNDHHFKAIHHKADLIRLHILHELGGVYFDLDVLSLRSFRRLMASNVIMAYEKHRDSEIGTKGLGNCVIIAPKPHHPFIKEWLAAYENEYGNNDSWTDLSIITPYKLSMQFPDLISCVPCHYFMPVMYWEYNKIFDNDSQEWSESYTLHLWETEASKTEDIPLDIDYFAGRQNMYTKLFKRYVPQYMFDTDYELAVMKAHRNKKEYLEAYSLGAVRINDKLPSLTPSQVCKFYDEMILLMSDQCQMYIELFIDAAKNAGGMEQIRNARGLKSMTLALDSKLQNKITEILEPKNIMDELGHINHLRFSNKKKEAYERVKYLHAYMILGKYRTENNTYVPNSRERMRLYDELIVNGFWVNKDEAYKFAVEWITWLENNDDIEQLKLMQSDPRSYNNILFFEDNEKLVDRINILFKNKLAAVA